VKQDKLYKAVSYPNLLSITNNDRLIKSRSQWMSDSDTTTLRHKFNRAEMPAAGRGKVFLFISS
jgi:hypothetical protein